MSKRFKKLPEKTSELPSEGIEKLIPIIKKNCTTKFDESVDLSFQINNKQKKNEINIRNIVGSITKKQIEDIAKKKMADLNAHDIEQASKIIAGSARSMGIEVKD